MSRASRAAFTRALRSLEAASGQDPATVVFRGQRPALVTRYRAAEGAAAALAGGAVLAQRLGESRGGSTGPVEVASRHVEASLLSFAHLRFLDEARAPKARLAPEQRTAAAGFQRTGDDRWVYLHAGFEHNTRGILELLGVADDRAAVARAVADRSGAELEQALGEAGLCGAMVRSPDEWDASVPGRLLGARPVVDIVQLDDAPAAPLPDYAKGQPQRPLDGVRVLDLTRVLAGPTCARTLASYGADVLRVGADHLPSIPLFVADTGFGKRSAHLDLRRTGDADTLRDLLRRCDVFSQGYRSGAMERRGFGPLEVARLRPGIIYVSINCYGHEGPWRARPGWEQLAQTVTGLAHDHGAQVDPERRPTLLPAAVTDYTTGYLAAYGALAALQRRATQGGSYWVRVSLARTGMWLRGLGLRRDLDASAATPEELARWQDGMDTAWGPVRYLRPAVQISGTPARWERPPAPLGSDPPSFD